MNDAVVKKILAEGASLVAFADLSRLPRSAGGDWPVGISIAIALNPAVVRRIPSGPHEDYSHEYDRVNAALDNLGAVTEKWLVSAGYNACAITRDRAPYEKTSYATRIPHKTAASLAGLGWIGKNALLVTMKFGCALRLTTVLTDAPLRPNAITTEPKCGSCTVCRDVCPGSAIKGKMWSDTLERDDLVNPGRCDETTGARGLDLKFRSATCGLCFAACPYTKRYLASLIAS
ncbi:MAG: epoxyqueuosine reductase [Synergistaceae bacterium]|jgi:epoxyqueuosine reductase QueG|nr:epoxyqueuosine reductase [Synergistaceae bacterium]